MIRAFRREDIDAVARIWLNSNIEAHDFIPAAYWEENLGAVKEMIPQAEVYVCTDDSVTGTEESILGFAGLYGDHIEGIFIKKEARGHGAGRALLDYLKRKKRRLTLNVYRKNERAVRFYEREMFCIAQETADEDTGEQEYLMLWEREWKS